MNKYLITGATGLVGMSITRRLIKLNNRPIVLVRNLEKAKMLFGDCVEYIVGNIDEIPVINCDIDYIIHAASPTKSQILKNEPVESFDVIVNGTKSILEFAKTKHIKAFVYVSSMEVYGDIKQDEEASTEDSLGYIDLKNTRSSYPEGKRASEFLCNAYYKEYGLPTIILRLANTFGPGVSRDDNRLFATLAKCVINQENIILHTSGESISNFVYIDDMVDAVMLILEKGCIGETYNISNEKETRTINEIAKMVADEIALGKIKVIHNVLKYDSSEYATNTQLVMNSGKIKKLGWTPKVGMKEAYMRLIDYFDKNDFKV